jgi:hypothetical protein
MGGYNSLTDQGLPMSPFSMPGMTGRTLPKTIGQDEPKLTNRLADLIMDRRKPHILLMKWLERGSTMKSTLVRACCQASYQNQ